MGLRTPLAVTAVDRPLDLPNEMEIGLDISGPPVEQSQHDLSIFYIRVSGSESRRLPCRNFYDPPRDVDWDRVLKGQSATSTHSKLP